MTWLEQPIPGRLARSTTAYVVLFGIMWTAIAAFWTVSAWDTSKPETGGFFRNFAVIGLLFILFGLFLLSSPYWARRIAKRSASSLRGQVPHGGPVDKGQSRSD